MTKKYYSIQGCYNGQWEEVTAEENHGEAMARLKEYRENDPRTAYRCRFIEDK